MIKIFGFDNVRLFEGMGKVIAPPFLTKTKGLLMRLKIAKGEVTPLNSNIACSISISCTHPDEDGHMHVEMNYEGDASLAAYLLEGAQQIISEKIEEEEISYPTSKCI